MRTQVIPLQKIFSKNKYTKENNGYIIPLWKDWENILYKEPKQMYLNVCFPGEVKGPHLHKVRCQQYACIKGTGLIVVKYGPKDYEEIYVDADKNPSVVVIPPGIPSAIKNTGKEEFVMINMPNPAWHPDNQDDHPVEFEDYQFK